MKIQIKQSMACLLLASLVPLQANAANVAWTGDIDSNWTTGGNWNTATAAGSAILDNADFSGSGDNAIINTPLLSYQLNQVRVSDGASLIINEPLSINNAMQLGAVASLGGGTIFQHADTNIAAALRIGHLATINTPSSYVVDDGTLTVGTQIFIRNGSFEIDSTKPTVSAFNMRVLSAGELIFDLGPQGVNTVTLSSDFKIDSGAKLVIDLSDYTQGANAIELVKFASINGSFSNDNVSIIGLEGGTLNYTDTSLTLTINEHESNLIGYQNEAWFALSVQACIGQDTDLAVNNGIAINDLSSGDMTCTQTANGDDMVYSVDWQGSDFDRDGIKDILTFDVRVEGFTGSTYTYSATAGASSVTALGASSPVTVDVNNDFWNVENDGVAGAGAGQSLRFSVENVYISATGYNATINGFNFVKLLETGGSAHTHIRGTGTGLDSSRFNHHNNGASSYSFIAQEEFVITGAGDTFSHLLGSVNQVQFSISIANPTLDTPFDDYDFSRYGLGPDIVGLYPKQDASREAYYPTFSWDNVPRWLAVRNTEAYTEEQITTIANHYDLVLLEKANSAGLTNNDEGIKETSRRLKELNPDIKNIFYWNSDIFYSGYSNDVEYEDNESAWSDLDSNGNVELFKGLYPTYNSEVAGLRDWWVELPTTIVTDENIDGVFVDKITKAAFDDLYKDNGDPVNGYVEMLKQLHDEMPEDKILIGNVLRGERNNGNRAPIEFFDGSYLERWDFEGDIQLPEQTKADAIALSIQLMREALAQGKLINFQTNPHTDEAVPDTYVGKLDYMARHVDFPLAIFLMAAEKNAFFSYQLSVNALPRAGEGWDSSHIEELNRQLGEPLGGPVKTGYIYTRSFEYVDVWLNLETEEATLTWRDTPISAN